MIYLTMILIFGLSGMLCEPRPRARIPACAAMMVVGFVEMTVEVTFLLEWLGVS